MAPVPIGYVGPADARVVIVGPAERLGALDLELGDAVADQCGWTTARATPPQDLRNRELVIAIGPAAWKWVFYHVRPKRMTQLPFRWETKPEYRKIVDDVIAIIRELVSRR